MKNISVICLLFIVSLSSYGQSTNTIFQNELKKLLSAENIDTVALRVFNTGIELCKKDPDSTLFYAHLLDTLAGITNKKTIEGLSLRLYGDVHTSFKDQVYAIDYFLKALRVEEELIESHEMTSRSVRNIAYINNSIAINYFRKGNYEKAKEYLDKSLKLINTNPHAFSERELRDYRSRVYNNLGSVNLQLKRPDDALEYYFNAIEILINVEVVKPQLYNNVGVCYNEKEEPDKAFHYFKMALDIAQEVNDDFVQVQIYNNLSRYYIEKKNFGKARESIEKSRKIGEKLKMPNSRAISLEHSAIINYSTGNYKKAFEEYRKFKSMTDSLVNIASTTKIAEIEKESILERRNQELKFKKERREAARKKRDIIIIFFAALALLASVIFILLFIIQKGKVKREQLKKRQYRIEKEKLQGELEYKNKELATNVMYLVRKNELISNISQRLLDIKSDLKKINQDPVQDIINELQRGVDSDTWKEFELRFQQVHQEFYDRLTEQYPNLSANERRLCAFLRLNMSTKEISAITFQSPNSIKIARTRLRKKLEITNQEINLVEYLSNF